MAKAVRVRVSSSAPKNKSVFFSDFVEEVAIFGEVLQKWLASIWRSNTGSLT